MDFPYPRPSLLSYYIIYYIFPCRYMSYIRGHWKGPPSTNQDLEIFSTGFDASSQEFYLPRETWFCSIKGLKAHCHTVDGRKLTSSLICSLSHDVCWWFVSCMCHMCQWFCQIFPTVVQPLVVIYVQVIYSSRYKLILATQGFAGQPKPPAWTIRWLQNASEIDDFERVSWQA